MELKKTADGSHTLYVKELNETYHSIHGAIQEARHVFIKNGLNYFNPTSNVSILEVGLGTGLNAILTCLNANDRIGEVHYTAVEKFPLSSSLIQQLNYASILELTDEAKQWFEQIHAASHQSVAIHPRFRFTKHHTDIHQFTAHQLFDVIYFDAFAPEKQAEMWTPELFKKLFDLLHPNGILVTYCAKGVVKRTIKSVGFTLETLQGPPGKREMIRGIKS